MPDSTHQFLRNKRVVAEHARDDRSVVGSGGDQLDVLPWTTTDAMGVNRQVVDAEPQASRTWNILHAEEVTRPRI
jgi:hypothetical protein